MSKLTNEILDKIRRAVALQLWELGAVKVNLREPFKLTSGNYSPIYINCRQLISSPAFVDLFAAAARIICEASAVQFDIVAGGETAGIPFAAFLGRTFGKPMIYVRKEVKTHGIASRIEGTIQSGAQVLLVEDLITDAGSKLTFIEAIQGANCHIGDVLVVFDRLQGGREALKRVGIRLHAMSDMDVAMEVAMEVGILTAVHSRSVSAYLKNPEAWHRKRKLQYIRRA
jgi:orotate phosphoribosyltransferase